MSKHTVVRHSGFGYNGDPTFTFAVESREVAKGDERIVEKAGGLLFEDYVQAEDYCEHANYFGGGSSLIPHVQGTFADKEIDGLAIYIPKRLTFQEVRDLYAAELTLIRAAAREGDEGLILKARATEIDTFLNVLDDMERGH